MATFFGIEIKTKEEQAQAMAEYMERIFPYGEAQKEQVARLLQLLFPKIDRKSLLVYYISIKDEMTRGNGKTFEAAAKTQKRTAIIRITPELIAGVKAVMMADFAAGEELNYPTIQELLASCLFPFSR